jgi:very-short-patch-repair endonuclease
VIAEPFIGAEAVRAGLVRKHELRSRYSALFPGVYLPRDTPPSFGQRVQAAGLWSHRQGVVAGWTASRLFGARWVDDSHPIELVWPNARPPSGITTSATWLADGEVVSLSGLPTTTLTRTAFDLARRRPVSAAIARLDSLGRAARLDLSEVLELAERHSGTRGCRQVRRVLDLHDPGAESPKESWLRLAIIGAGFPRPRTQIPVRGPSGRQYYLDLGWEDLKIAVEYDGDHHRSDKRTFGYDIVRLEEIASLGWIVIRVVAGTPRDEVVRRVRAAWAARTPSTLR